MMRKTKPSPTVRAPNIRNLPRSLLSRKPKHDIVTLE